MNTLSQQSATPPQESLPDIPFGYCHCGCGQKTRIETQDRLDRGRLKGCPARYVPGHHRVAPRHSSRIIIIDGKRCCTIPLTRGKDAIVYEEDLGLVSVIRWRAANPSAHLWYAEYTLCNPDGTKRRLSMHEMLKPTPEGFEVDHINGNGLDNRRCNLRQATRTQNSHNRGKHVRATSRYKCVWWNRWKGFWESKVSINGKQIRVGLFTNELDAARAYDKVAILHYGEFARLNFPTGSHKC